MFDGGDGGLARGLYGATQSISARRAYAWAPEQIQSQSESESYWFENDFDEQ